MKAVVVQKGAVAQVVDDHPIPEPAADQVQIQVKAAGVNPTDWKHVKWLSKPGMVSGCDFAGVVTKVGSNVQGYKVGDRLAGVVHGGASSAKGSFAEYLVTKPGPTFRLPDSMSFEEAAAFGVSSGTAAIALFQHLALQSPEKPYASGAGPKLLIWGAGSYAGIFAIQLAKAAGIRTVVTASPANHEFLKSLGAEAAFDYRDPEAGKKIKEWAGGELVYGLDCISENTTVPLASNAMTGGTLVLLLSGAVKHPANNPNVKLHPMLLYTSMGEEFVMGGNVFPASETDYKWGVWWWNLCSQLTLKGQVTAPNLKVLEGLSAFQTAFDALEQGKVKAEKLILKV